MKETYNEKDLEAAILREMERFLLELGAGFTFVARQKRIVIDGEDFYLDLLFYHRKLRRLVAVELKLDRFRAADKGQLELYLRWLEKYEKEPGEEAPIGLILCADKGDERVELLELDRSGIRVASYLTDLPPRPLLRRNFREAMIRPGRGSQVVPWTDRSEGERRRLGPPSRRDRRCGSWIDRSDRPATGRSIADRRVGGPAEPAYVHAVGDRLQAGSLAGPVRSVGDRGITARAFPDRIARD